MTMKGVYSSLAVQVLVLLVIVQGSWQLPVPEADSSSSLESADEEPMSVTSDVNKRHSEGTFSNDYSKYLEDRRAQEFVRWLMSNKRSGAAEKRHADGTFTSDASSFRRDQAVQDFVAMLKAGQAKRASDMTDRSSDEGSVQKRQVDGTFTSDVNKVLESMAAKEYLLWVMSHPSGDSKKRQESH